MPKPVPLQLKPGASCKLSELDAEAGSDRFDKESAETRVAENARVIAGLAQRLYAERKQAILLVLQGMDTSGKDGTIRTIMKGVNPQSCQVVSFKKPTEEELDHDFLWRVHNQVPRKGNIGIFNRSHYEDVLIVRVHQLVPEKVWSKRYDQINEFEELLSESGTRIIKCFLHITKEEQRKRLQARIDDPEDHWKFNPLDLAERKHWDAYQRAYEEAIQRCNTANAPWYIIPSDRKWYRNLVVSQLLRSQLEELKPEFPPSQTAFEGLVVE